jgi:hypothetical protein
MKWLIIGVLVLIVVVIVGLAVTVRRRADRLALPSEILEAGWQFTPKPTARGHEPPGTIFRIDRQKRRYLVERLNVPVNTAREAFGKSEVVIETRMSILAGFLGLSLIRPGGSSRFTQKLNLQLTDPIRETTADVDIDPALDEFKPRLRYRADNRYFVIRAARLASGMIYLLSREQKDIIEGLSEQEAMKLKVQSVRRQKNSYHLQQNFPEIMQVMFLAEEIGPIRTEFVGRQPELGVFPVTEILEFDDGETGSPEWNP